MTSTCHRTIAPRARSQRRLAPAAALLVAGLLAVGCGRSKSHLSEDAPTPEERFAARGGPFDRVERGDLNRLAAELDLPLFWMRNEADGRVLAPKQLRVLWGVASTSRGAWVQGDSFTLRFREAYDQMVARQRPGRPPSDPSLEPAEARRRAAVRRELAQGQPMVVATSFRGASAEDRAIVGHVMAAAAFIERIFAQQRGWGAWLGHPPADPESRMLLYRNQGPWCEAPETEADPDCNAYPSRPKQISGLYPAALQADSNFCDRLLERDDGEELLHQFVVVRERDGELYPVPYTEAYRADMERVSRELRQAAADITSESEQALQAYLLAAADAFVDNQWEPADEAWAKMNAENSRFYLRIGPDETYFEPCSRKAGFHVSFALINQDSLAWQHKLDPLKNDMEQAIAERAGEPYRARTVSFHLPDFIDVVLNAGDSRSPMGATIGQSLPNWGPVANEGRGRTVAMTNLYTDPDSLAALETQAASLLCSDSYARLTTAAEPMTMSTVLHEAAHNLGPAHEYTVEGKKDTQIFGGPLASTLEELKAQTAALYLADWLAARGIIPQELAAQAHVRDVLWAFGHISRGLYTADDKPRPYSQLAAIQIGFLLEQGAIRWQPETLAHNGTDVGCFELHLESFPAAVAELMRQVAGIKARGAYVSAKELVASFVDVEGEAKARLELIRERWLRAPKATFVYSIEL